MSSLLLIREVDGLKKIVYFIFYRNYGNSTGTWGNVWKEGKKETNCFEMMNVNKILRAKIWRKEKNRVLLNKVPSTENKVTFSNLEENLGINKVRSVFYKLDLFYF